MIVTHWKRSLWMRNSVLSWKWQISWGAIVPGLCVWGFLMPLMPIIEVVVLWLALSFSSFLFLAMGSPSIVVFCCGAGFFQCQFLAAVVRGSVIASWGGLITHLLKFLMLLLTGQLVFLLASTLLPLDAYFILPLTTKFLHLLMPFCDLSLLCYPLQNFVFQLHMFLFFMPLLGYLDTHVWGCGLPLDWPFWMESLVLLRIPPICSWLSSLPLISFYLTLCWLSLSFSCSFTSFPFSPACRASSLSFATLIYQVTWNKFSPSALAFSCSLSALLMYHLAQQMLTSQVTYLSSSVGVSTCPFSFHLPLNVKGIGGHHDSVTEPKHQT